MSIEVCSPQLDRLAGNLDAAAGHLKHHLEEAGRKAGKAIDRDVRASAQATLPRSGGLAAKVAGGRFEARARITGGGVSLDVEADGSYDLQRLDSGQVVHPVWGGPGWAQQSIAPGWFSRPVSTTGAQRFRSAIEDALRRLAQDIERV